jgi:hypothetical protein
VLTGHPIRVRKRFAVVRHLFYEPQVRQLMQRYLLSIPAVVLSALLLLFRTCGGSSLRSW